MHRVIAEAATGDTIQPIHIAIVLNMLVAINTTLFWIGFFTEMIFPIDVLSPLIHNFEGYYAWERCFVVPDMITALVAVIASTLLLKNRHNVLGGLLLAASAGAWCFLGILDFTYAVNNGMYSLSHWFGYILLSIGVGLPVVGGVTLWALYLEKR